MTIFGQICNKKKTGGIFQETVALRSFIWHCSKYMPVLQIYKKMSDSSKRLFEAEEQCGLYAVARSSKVNNLKSARRNS